MKDFLKKVPLFTDLPDEDLERLCEMVNEVDLPAGEILFVEGSQGNQLYVIEKGKVEITKSSGGREILLSVRGAGDVIGEMSLMDDAPRIASVRAQTDCQLIAITREQFEHLLANSPSAARIILRTVTTRFRNTEAALRQSEKMAQIGTVTAGLAHEVNNPASAAQRSAQQLRQAFNLFRDSSREMAAQALSSEQEEVLSSLEADLLSRSAVVLSQGALERSSREEEVESWLEEAGIEVAWETASQLADLGMGLQELDQLRQHFSNESLQVVLNWFSSSQSMEASLEVIEQGLGRVLEIVNALRTQIFLDQAPIQSVDIQTGLDNTLFLLKSKLDGGPTIQRDYDSSLPKILAYGSELNQVWMHLIDNAIDALGGMGTITIRTRREEDGVKVEIEDDGPGIPENIQSKVFDPFFTTKPPGKGTGLGLNIVYTVIQKHLGEVRLSSQPGKTVFLVRLPIDFERVRFEQSRSPGITSAREDWEQ